MEIRLLVVLLFMINFNCYSQTQYIDCGSMIFKEPGINANYKLAYDDNIENFALRDRNLSGLILMNTSRRILGILKVDVDSLFKNQFVSYDFLGNQKRIEFESSQYHNVGLLSLSHDDSKLIYVAEEPWEGLASLKKPNRLNSIFVTDLSLKKNIITGNEIFSSNKLTVFDNAWDNTNSMRFVFACGRRQTNSKYLKGEVTQGIYIFDLDSMRIDKIANSGTNPIWSRSGKYICYISDKSVKKYNVKSKQVETIYTVKKNGNINSIYWNPCSENELLIVYWHKSMNIFESSSTKYQTLNVETKEIKNKNYSFLKQSFYSWKR